MLGEASARLATVSESPAIDAQVLLCFLMGWSTTQLMLAETEIPAPGIRQDFFVLVHRRAAGEPVAYITGYREFWSHSFRVSPHTLIPRADTETLVSRALELVSAADSLCILDLGCGSGNIAISIALERPGCRVTGIDISTGALEIARQNAENLGCENVQFLRANWFDFAQSKNFDLIVGNPPYIADGDAHLEQGDLPAEPISALTSGPDGLDDIRRIVADAADHLNPRGHLILEHGFDQGARVRTLFSRAGFEDVTSHRDLGGIERISEGRRPG